MATNPVRQAMQQRVATAVLEGAARTLAVQGSAASMSDVAAAAGVARATVYRYFPNRQALLDELALMALKEADDRISSARIDEVPTAEAISRVVRALVDIGDAFIVVARERARPADFDQTLVDPLTRFFGRSQADGDERTRSPRSRAYFSTGPGGVALAFHERRALMSRGSQLLQPPARSGAGCGPKENR